MNHHTSRILDEISMLPTDERAALVAGILASLAPTEDKSISSLWLAEVKQRLEELDAGRIVAAPLNEVLKRVDGWSA